MSTWGWGNCNKIKSQTRSKQNALLRVLRRGPDIYEREGVCAHVSGEHHCSRAICCSLAGCRRSPRSFCVHGVNSCRQPALTRMSVAADKQQLLQEITHSNTFKMNSRKLDWHREQSDSVLGGGKGKVQRYTRKYSGGCWVTPATSFILSSPMWK